MNWIVATTLVLAQGAEPPQLLNVIAESQTAKIESIETWGGSVVTTSQFPVQDLSISLKNAPRIPESVKKELVGDIWRISTGCMLTRQHSGEFKFSTTQQAVRSTYMTEGDTVCFVPEAGVKFSIPSNFEYHNLLHPDGIYVLDAAESRGELSGLPDSTSPDRSTTRVVEKREAPKSPTAFGAGNYMFHPMWVFESDNKRIDAIFRRYSELASDPKYEKLIEVVDQRDGSDTVTIRRFFRISGSELAYTLEWTLDSELGYLPIRLIGVTGDLVTDERTWSYELNDGVLTPRTVSESQFNEQGMTHRNQCEFVVTRVNQELQSSDFELSSLPLADGDRLWDRITNKLSILQDGNFVSVPAGGINTPAIATGPSYFRYIIIANVLVLFLIVLFRVWSNRYKPHEAKQEHPRLK